MKSLLGNRLHLFRLAITLLSIALLVYLLSQQGWDQIRSAVAGIAPWRLGLAFGLMLVSRLAVSGRWYSLLRSAGVKVTYLQSAKVTFAGLFASNFLPTTVGGDVVRLAGAVQMRLDAAVSAASLVVDRLIGMAGMAMAAPWGVPVLLSAVGESGLANRDIGAALFDRYRAVAGSLAAVAPALWLRSGWSWFTQALQRLMKALVLWRRKPRALFVSLLLTWIHMLCLFGVIAVLLEGMGVRASLWRIGGLYSLVYFITLLPFSINGYGFQEISMTFVFSNLTGASVSNALTLALLFRTLMMVASLPGAFFIPGVLAGMKADSGPGWT